MLCLCARHLQPPLQGTRFGLVSSRVTSTASINATCAASWVGVGGPSAVRRSRASGQLGEAVSQVRHGQGLQTMVWHDSRVCV